MFGFIFCNLGNISNASASGSPTSVISTSAKPVSTRRHIPAAVPLDLTLKPARVNAVDITILILLSSSTTITFLFLLISNLTSIFLNII